MSLLQIQLKEKGIKEFENDPVWHARQLKGDEIIIGKKKA